MNLFSYDMLFVDMIRSLVNPRIQSLSSTHSSRPDTTSQPKTQVPTVSDEESFDEEEKMQQNPEKSSVRYYRKVQSENDQEINPDWYPNRTLPKWDIRLWYRISCRRFENSQYQIVDFVNEFLNNVESFGANACFFRTLRPFNDPKKKLFVVGIEPEVIGPWISEMGRIRNSRNHPLYDFRICACNVWEARGNPRKKLKEHQNHSQV